MKGPILVTGAAGMIGSAAIWELNRRGRADIIAVDRLGTSEKWRNLAPLTIADYWEADELLSRLEAGGLGAIGTAIHLGACSSTTEENGSYLMRNNFRFTKLLAHWAVREGVRFVYASSAATYGLREQGLRPGEPLAALQPLNCYAYSKHLFDLYAGQSGLLPRIAGLKYFNVFGPNEDHKGPMRSVVWKGFHEIRATGRVKLFKSYRPDYADGAQQRDFIYVKDAVDVTLHFAGKDAGGLYDVGSGKPHTWLELVNAIFSALGREPRVEFIEMPEGIRAHYQYSTCADLDRLRASGYTRPCRPLESSVAEYVSDYLVPGKRLGESFLQQKC